jgi:hypothetical protein
MTCVISLTTKLLQPHLIIPASSIGSLQAVTVLHPFAPSTESQQAHPSEMLHTPWVLIGMTDQPLKLLSVIRQHQVSQSVRSQDPLAHPTTYFFSDVRACWRRFQQVSHGTENLQAQLSRCKDFTERYIQDGSSSFDSARHALLDLADHNNLFVPTVTIDPTVVRTLLQYWLSIGYDINQRDRYGNTILLRECSVSYSNWTLGQAWITYLSILVEHGADLHATNICIGCGALHVLMRSIAARNFDPFTKEKLEAVSDALVLFLSAGCDPNARDFWGKMPLDHSKSWRGILTFSDLERSRVLEAVWRGALMRTSRARKRLAEQRASAS